MSNKFLPDNCDAAAWLRDRAQGHAPGYDISVYARPATWLSIATEIDRLRAELAEAKARIAEVLATDAKRVDEYNTLLGVIAAAKARIAELETERAKLSSFHDMLTKLSHAIARAEKAEARIAELEKDNSEIEIAVEALRGHRELNDRAKRAEARIAELEAKYNEHK